VDGKNTAGSYSALVVLETGPPCAGAFYMLPQYRAALDVRQGALPCRRSLQGGNRKYRNQKMGMFAKHFQARTAPHHGMPAEVHAQPAAARACACVLERRSIRAPATSVMRRHQIQGLARAL